VTKRIIKGCDERDDDISALTSLLENYSLTQDKRSWIEQEIRNISAGLAAEKRAAYLLGQFVESGSTAYLINDLRLDVDGHVAQIDHVTINRYGIVRLFETKSFSTGIKITPEGSFLRWDGFSKRYIEIPSPLQQSKRHATALKKALKNIGYKVTDISHYVVVDYKARLIKPKRGFDNVCRPDAVENAICKGADNIEGIDLFFKAASMLMKRIKDEDCFTFARNLASLHKPIAFDYKAKFGLSEDDRQTLGNEGVVEHSKLTLANLAKNLNKSINELNGMLVAEGYMEWRGRYLYLTAKGRNAGIEFRKGARGYYFLFPLSFVI
jgi:hypothetical protein